MTVCVHFKISILHVQVSKCDLCFLQLKVFNCQEVDYRLALALLVNRPKNEGQKMLMSLIKASGHKYNKLKVRL